MPLTVLLPLVIVGITLIVLLVRVMAPTPALVFRDPEEVRAVWDRRHPDLPAGSVRLDDSGRHALVETARGAGIVWTLGADPVTRLLSRDMTMTETETGLVIDLHDFTAPRFRIDLATPAARAAWANTLQGTST